MTAVASSSPRSSGEILCIRFHCFFIAIRGFVRKCETRIEHDPAAGFASHAGESRVLKPDQFLLAREQFPT
jgi:hypothetical protein